MDQTPHRKIHFREFKELCRAVLTYEDLNLLTSHIAGYICRFFNVKACSVMLFDEHEKQLFRVSCCGVSDEYLQKGPVFVDDKYTAFITGEPVFVENFQNDPRVQYPEAAQKEGLVSMLSVPIKYQNAPIGLIRVYHDEIWKLDNEDLDSFCLMAALMGQMIEYSGLKNFLDKLKVAMETLPSRLL